MGGPLGEIKWVSSLKNTNNIHDRQVEPKYSFLGERIRHVAPTNLQCSMFCGGKQCKYCNPAKFAEDEMAIKGLYSSWVTENILATSRPTFVALKEYNVIEQFKREGISSIINLQHSGEHGACGFGLDEDSGFSYSPKEFMDNDVFFYNFGWNDYGVRSLHSILDMVKVMDFALSNGKVAIHCHAGLGRTGVLIACYLIYSQRLSAKQAILEVRKSRPKAIQTRGQITCVNEFYKCIQPMWVHFTEDGDDKVSFTEYMNNQRSLLHGEESRTLRYIPKICFVICQRLLELGEKDFDLSIVTRITRFNFMQNSSLKEAPTSCQPSEQNVRDQNSPQNENNYIDSPRNSSPGEHNSNEDEIESETVKDDIISEQEDLFKESLTNNDIESNNNDDAINKPTDDSNSDDDVVIDHVTRKNGSRRESENSNHDNSVSNPPLIEASTNHANEPNNNLSFDVPTENKRGGLFLEPIKTKKKAKSKKRRNKKGAEKSSGVNTETSDVIDKDNSSYEKNTNQDSCSASNTESNSLEDITQDNVSLASFSSTANEGLSISDIVLKQIAYRCSNADVIQKVDRYKRKLNCSDESWSELSEETNGAVLSGLFWAWLVFMQEPIIDDKISNQIASKSDPVDAVKEIPREIRKLTECYLTVVTKLRGNAEFYDRALNRFAAVMTSQSLSKVSSNAKSKNGRSSVFHKFITDYAEILCSQYSNIK